MPRACLAPPRRVRARRLPLVHAVLLALLAGCSPSVARVANPAAPECQESLRDAFAVILVGQEEKPDVAEAMAAAAARQLADVDLGPRPFQLSSPSGTDYAFFFDDERSPSRCLLRLVAWQKGFVQYSNNVTYIATRPLPGCRCER
ncbi:MAG: hypothetical protein AB1689_16470 [Thermodesulfobacteriota bacterium]